MNQQSETTQLRQALKSLNPWLKIMGVVNIVIGVPNIILLIGLVNIWLGVVLLQASSNAQRYLISGTPEQLGQMLRRIRLYFILDLVTVILGLVMPFLIFCAWSVLTGMAMDQSSRNLGMY